MSRIPPSGRRTHTVAPEVAPDRCADVPTKASARVRSQLDASRIVLTDRTWRSLDTQVASTSDDLLFLHGMPRAGQRDPLGYVKAERPALYRAIVHFAKAADVDPIVLLTIASTESGMRLNTKANNQGMFQVTPLTRHALVQRGGFCGLWRTMHGGAMPAIPRAETSIRTELAFAVTVLLNARAEGIPVPPFECGHLARDAYERAVMATRVRYKGPAYKEVALLIATHGLDAARLHPRMDPPLARRLEKFAATAMMVHERAQHSALTDAIAER